MTALRPLAIVLMLLLAGTGTWAAPAFLATNPDQTRTFVVTRDGGAIGHHTYTFHRRGDRIEVRVSADIRVSVLFYPFYVFEQTGLEVWKDGHLASLDYVTNDDGTQHAVKAEAVEGGFDVSVDGKTPVRLPEMIPGSLWRQPPAQATMMLDPGDGKPSPLTIKPLGEDTVTVRGKPTRTTHWLWDDGLRREVWYDADQALVQVWIRGDDGSDIYYVLK